MKKMALTENETKVIKLITDGDIKQHLLEGFMTNQFMTVEDFCDKLEVLKASLIEKHKIKYGGHNSNK